MRKDPPIYRMDLDMTNNCVLACDYCFRGEKNERRLTWEVGTRAIDWLIEKSQNQKKLSVSLFGGEPLMEFKLIKRLVPYAKKRAAERGKTVHFTAVTNSVLVTDEIIDFFRKYNMNFHTSIDGGPETQDAHRHFPNGKGTSKIIEPKIKKILKYWPNRTARSTISNDVVHRWMADVEYLVGLGYKHLAMILIPDQEWSGEQWETLKSELRKISDFYIERYRQGKPIYIKHIEDAMKAIVKPTRRSAHCGAGRSSVLIRTDGTIYPCHRFGGEIDAESENQWCLGSIFEGFNKEKRQKLLNLDCRKHVKADCENCIAVHMCGISCIAINWANFKDIFKPHPTQCKFNVLFFKEAMRIHYILDSEQNVTFAKKFHPERYKNNRNTNGQRHSINAQEGNNTKKLQEGKPPRTVFVMLGSSALSPCFIFNSDNHKVETRLSLEMLKSVLKWAMRNGGKSMPDMFFIPSEKKKLSPSISTFLGGMAEQILVPLVSLQKQRDLQIPFTEKQTVISSSIKQLVAEKDSISGRPVITHVAHDEIERLSDMLLSIKDTIPQITLRLRNANELSDDQIETYKKHLAIIKDVISLNNMLKLGGIHKINNNGGDDGLKCPAGSRLLTIGPDGLAYPCPAFYLGGLSGQSLGSLSASKGSFDIFNNDYGCDCESETCPGCKYIELSDYENGKQVCNVYKAELS